MFCIYFLKLWDHNIFGREKLVFTVYLDGTELCWDILPNIDDGHFISNCIGREFFIFCSVVVVVVVVVGLLPVFFSFVLLCFVSFRFVSFRFVCFASA